MERGLHNELSECTNEFDWAELYFLCSCLSFSPGGQHGHVQPFSDEDASIETLSHCSSFSDTASVADEGSSSCVKCASIFAWTCEGGCVCVQSNCEVQFNQYFVSRHSYQYFFEACQTSVCSQQLVVLPGGESSEDAAQEDFQYKLKGFIDSTVDKRLMSCLISTVYIHTLSDLHMQTAMCMCRAWLWRKINWK